VEIAMRYGNPSPQYCYDKLMKENAGLEEVILFPLYPHYAMSSYETAVDYMKNIHTKNSYPFKLTVIKPFYNNTGYINALADSIQPYLEYKEQHILFSYHGIPARHLHKTGFSEKHCLQSKNCCSIHSPAHSYCYRHQVFETTRLVAQQLGLDEKNYSISFQSRLGKGWLEPFTDIRLAAMPGENIKNLLVVCPAFVSDCLETLEEIAIRGKEIFLQAGGESYTMIPCLNIQPAWIHTMAKWIKDYESGDKRLIFS